MQDARLIKSQGTWIAFLTGIEGKTAPFSLQTELSDQEAEKINALDANQRISLLLEIVHYPVAIEA